MKGKMRGCMYPYDTNFRHMPSKVVCPNKTQVKVVKFMCPKNRDIGAHLKDLGRSCLTRVHIRSSIPRICAIFFFLPSFENQIQIGRRFDIKDIHK